MKAKLTVEALQEILELPHGVIVNDATFDKDRDAIFFELKSDEDFYGQELASGEKLLATDVPPCKECNAPTYGRIAFTREQRVFKHAGDTILSEGVELGPWVCTKCGAEKK